MCPLCSSQTYMNLSLSPLLATADFEELTDVLLTIPSGSAAGFTVCIIVAIIGDLVRENDETFVIEVQTLNSNDIITTYQQHITIMDDGDGKLIFTSSRQQWIEASFSSYSYILSMGYSVDPGS